MGLLHQRDQREIKVNVRMAKRLKGIKQMKSLLIHFDFKANSDEKKDKDSCELNCFSSCFYAPFVLEVCYQRSSILSSVVFKFLEFGMKNCIKYTMHMYMR